MPLVPLVPEPPSPQPLGGSDAIFHGKVDAGIDDHFLAVDFPHTLLVAGVPDPDIAALFELVSDRLAVVAALKPFLQLAVVVASLSARR